MYISQALERRFKRSTSRCPTSSRPWTRRLKRLSLDDWKTYLRGTSSTRCADSAGRVRERELRILRQDADGRRNCGRAGSAAWSSRITTWVKRSARSTSSRPSARKAKNGPSRWSTRWRRRWAETFKHLDWMTPATKKQALEKLHAITNKIGYPGEMARLFERLKIMRDDASAIRSAPNTFEFKRQIAQDRQAGGQEPSGT